MSISVKRSEIVQNELALIDELVQLIENSKKQVSVAVNSTLTLLFWNVGMRINNHILDNKRAEYGKQIVPTVSAQFDTIQQKSSTKSNYYTFGWSFCLFSNCECTAFTIDGRYMTY